MALGKCWARRILVALLLGVPGSAPGQQPDDAILSSWLDAHARLETWSAELVQTRHLAALTHPLISTGSVHYSRPGLFRWELGQPPDTIAIRSTNELLLVYPRLKRAERYLITQGATSSIGRRRPSGPPNRCLMEWWT